jgi:hypothetical protein
LMISTVSVGIAMLYLEEHFVMLLSFGRFIRATLFEQGPGLILVQLVSCQTCPIKAVRGGRSR